MVIYTLKITIQSMLLLGTLLSVAEAGGASSPLDFDALDQFVAQEMKNYDVPGVSLAIVENGKIAYIHGYGVKDVVLRTPVDADTQFAIGSVTKSFTALGIMRLVDQGKVKLDAPVINYLPEFKLADPAATKTVTVRNLLTHTTGLARDDSYFFDPNVSEAKVIASAATTPLVGKPGKVFVYSNENAVLAGAVIERVSGQSWEAFTRQEILQPLGMNKTSFTQAAMKQTGNYASPNTYDVLRGLVPTPFYVLAGRAAAGAINSSAAELAKYLQYQLGDGVPLLTGASLRAMHTTFIQTDGGSVGAGLIASAKQVAQQKNICLALSPLSDSGYAFFLGTEKFQGHQIVEHGGNTNGFTANISMVPSQRSGVVILVDSEHADLFIEVVRWYVLQALLGTQPPLDTSAFLQSYYQVLGQDNATRRLHIQEARTYQPTAAELDTLIGTYPSKGASPVQVRRSGSHSLKLKASMQGITYDVTLVPLGKNRFIANSQPLIGGLIRFEQKGNRQSVALEGPLGNQPLGERQAKAR